MLDRTLRRYLATSAPVATRDAASRLVDYIFSDESVARDGNTIATDGWKLDNFRANPVFLWAHDSGAPPIGRVTNPAPKVASDSIRLPNSLWAGKKAWPIWMAKKA